MPKLDLPKIDLPKIELPELPKFDLPEVPAAAAKPVYAYVGATDLAVEKVVAYVIDAQAKVTAKVADVQKQVKDFELPKPKALQDKATASLTERRSKVEARFNELQADAKSFPAKVQTGVKTRVDETTTVATATYAELAKRGEAVVVKFRGEAADAAEQVVDAVEPTPQEKAAATRAKKSTAKKAPAKKTAAKKAPAKKAPAKKAPAKKAATTTAPATTSGTTSA